MTSSPGNMDSPSREADHHKAPRPQGTSVKVSRSDLQQLKELKDQMEVLREQLQSEAELKCTYQRALGFKNAAKKISELTDVRSQRTR